MNRRLLGAPKLSFRFDAGVCMPSSMVDIRNKKDIIQAPIKRDRRIFASFSIRFAVATSLLHSTTSYWVGFLSVVPGGFPCLAYLKVRP